jgi:23S rRNA pseudouridine2605 synthase
MHLNVFIAKSGFSSRRRAATLIKEGRVRVGEKIVKEPWFPVKENDRILVDNQELRLKKLIYIIFNKPKGVTTTLKDRFASRKITDFLPAGTSRVYPAGRLDKDSRGLIILTNDGELCYKLTHPRFEVEKEYEILIKGKINSEILEEAKRGIKDGGDLLKLKSVVIDKMGVRSSCIRAVVCEGKKRHLRRLFAGLGFSVMDLKRVRIGRLHLGNLKEGSLRIADKKTIYSKTLEK